MGVLVDSVVSDLDNLRSGVVILLAMKGLKAENLSLDLEKVLIKTFQNRYPIRIKQFYILDANILIRGAIKIAKVIMGKKLSGRIVSVKSSGDKNGLSEFIDLTQLPPVLGGTFNAINAWDYVLNASSNAFELMRESQEEEKSEDDDSKWMKEKTMEFEKGSAEKKNSKRMSKIMVFGKNKLSSAKTKIIESKSKIKQKRDERKLKKQNENEANDDEKNDDDLVANDDNKKPKSLPFKKREEPVTKTDIENQEEEAIKVQSVEKVNDKSKQEIVDD